ncbi:Immunoglobulin superfamily member 22 [Holothuria leucospilota]|uniref:Immunoglobulin superfamily member 22 n=1 Tax=Holothuria leucospilota TaxID=206669 RepID=A0A9Q1C8Y3_HOLLE|nr:Immunoglobulin superfamily member 22 [Holothuria leucospilota]
MSSRDFRDTATHGDFAKHLLESHSRFCEFCRKNANLTPTETFPIPDQPPASYTVFTDACTQTETESPDDDATADSSQALPALSSPPTEVTLTNSSVTIQWPSWDENTDVGDPPIVGYIPYYRKQGDNIWIPESHVPKGDQLQFTFNNLDSDTYYSFSVAAVREGEGGEGSRSPPFEVKTLCAGNITVL